MGRPVNLRVGARVERNDFMELSQVLTAFIGWAVVSVPVSLLIGAFMGHGSQAPDDVAVPVRASRRA
jgi:hypothetical protein